MLQRIGHCAWSPAVDECQAKDMNRIVLSYSASYNRLPCVVWIWRRHGAICTLQRQGKPKQNVKVLKLQLTTLNQLWVWEMWCQWERVYKLFTWLEETWLGYLLAPQRKEWLSLQCMLPNMQQLPEAWSWSVFVVRQRVGGWWACCSCPMRTSICRLSMQYLLCLVDPVANVKLKIILILTHLVLYCLQVEVQQRPSR
jgi:hypothetical protein